MENKARIKVVKEVLRFEDGKQVNGVRVILAPKISKFISLNGENAELLQAINPNFAHWYMTAGEGRETYFEEIAGSVANGLD